LIIGLSGLTSWQKVVQAEMLPYTTATNPNYFPGVVVPVLVQCLRLATSQQVHATSDTPIHTIGYPAEVLK